MARRAGVRLGMKRKFVLDGEYFTGSLGVASFLAFIALFVGGLWLALRTLIDVFGFFMLVFGVKEFLAYWNSPYRRILDADYPPKK